MAAHHRGRPAAGHARADGRASPSPRSTTRTAGPATATRGAMLMVESDRRWPRRPTRSWPRRRRPARRGRDRHGALARDAQEADWLREARRGRTGRSSAPAWRAWRTSACRAPRAGADRARSSTIAAATGLRIGVFGHAGDGNLHPNFILTATIPTAEEKDQRSARRAVPRRAGAGWHDHRRARHGRRQEALACAPARRARGRADALDQVGPRPERAVQPGQGPLGQATV